MAEQRQHGVREEEDVGTTCDVFTGVSEDEVFREQRTGWARPDRCGVGCRCPWYLP